MPDSHPEEKRPTEDRRRPGSRRKIRPRRCLGAKREECFEQGSVSTAFSTARFPGAVREDERESPHQTTGLKSL